MNIVLAFIAFNFLVLVHEFGHFAVAKLSGIKVKEFSLFLGPKIFSIKRGETVYSLRLLPILAYVKMEGEEEDSDSAMAFNKKSPGIRAAVSLAGPFANLIAAVIILTIVFSITGFNTTGVSIVEVGSPAADSSVRAGDKIISYDNKKVYQPIDILQFLYANKGKPAELILLRGNERLKTTIIPKMIPEEKRYLFGFSVQQAEGENSNVIKDILQGTPAARAGLKTGDRIIKLNDVDILNKKAIDSFMLDNKVKTVKVTVLRGDSTVSFSITPQMEKISEQYYLGIDFKNETGNIFKTIRQSVIYTWSTVRNVAYGLVWLIEGKVSFSQMMGPVGIVSTIGSVVKQSPTTLLAILNLLNITAFISIALGATNLIPFPALDGSKVVLIIIEVIRRKPIPVEKEAFITMIGFVLIIILAVFTFYNDILRIVIGG